MSYRHGQQTDCRSGKADKQETQKAKNIKYKKENQKT